MISEASVRRAINHLGSFGDTDLFPRLPEMRCFLERPGTIAKGCEKPEHRLVHPGRRCRDADAQVMARLPDRASTHRGRQRDLPSRPSGLRAQTRSGTPAKRRQRGVRISFCRGRIS